jgi:hypothetical protein
MADSWHTMMALVKEKSDFYYLTLACQKIQNSGVNYFYEFPSLELVSLSETNNLVSLQGTIIASINSLDIVDKGKFASTCSKEKSSKLWKLNNIEIDWR